MSTLIAFERLTEMPACVSTNPTGARLIAAFVVALAGDGAAATLPVLRPTDLLDLTAEVTRL